MSAGALLLFNRTWRKGGSAYRATPLNRNTSSSGPRPETLFRILSSIYSDIRSGIYSDILSGIELASIPTFFLGSILTFFLGSILTFFLASILTFFLASFLTFYVALAVEVRQCPLRSGPPGPGPAIPTEIWRSHDEEEEGEAEKVTLKN